MINEANDFSGLEAEVSSGEANGMTDADLALVMGGAYYVIDGGNPNANALDLRGDSVSNNDNWSMQYTPPPAENPPGAGGFPPGTPGMLQPGNNIGQEMGKAIENINWGDAARVVIAEAVEYGAGKLPPVADYVGGKIAEWIRPD